MFACPTSTTQFSKPGVAKKIGGFTLIELVVSAVLGAIILMSAATLFGAYMKGSSSTNMRRQVSQEGTFILNTMEREIRNAKGATVNSACDGKWKINGTLTIEDEKGIDVIFKISGTNITRNGALLNSGNVILTSATPLRFKCTSISGKQQVDIEFTLKPSTVSGDEQSQTFKSTVSVRNTGF